MDSLWRNIRSIVEDEIRGETECFIIYPFSDVGHLVKEILELDYGKKPIIVDDILSKYNENIITTEMLKKLNPRNSVVLLSVGNPIGVPFFTETIERIGIRCCDVREPRYVLNCPEKGDRFKKLKKLWNVKSVRGGQKFIRVGRNNDGGYIMYEDFSRIKTAYSFGINKDVSWEKSMAGYGIKCYMYDHTINELPEENELFSWQKKGIGGIDEPEKLLFSLETLLKENGDLNNKELILKMDVEGAEWDFLKNTSSELLDNFMQIVFELHRVTLLSEEYIIPMIEKLSMTHTPVWLHANNFAKGEKAAGITLSPSMEVLYLSNRCYEFGEGAVRFPWILDMPNNPKIPEIILGEF